MLHIDKDTYQIATNNFFKTKTDKKQILISLSLRKSNYHVIHLQHKEMGNTKDWNMFTISRDGIIYQHFDENYYSSFMGFKNIDKQIISVVLENMGFLIKNKENYFNWLNEKCDKENVFMKKWMGYEYWEHIPEKQMKSLVDLSIYLCDKHNIQKKCIDFKYYHKDIIKFNGIVFKSNYIDDSSDFNPMFNIEDFNLTLNEKQIVENNK